MTTFPKLFLSSPILPYNSNDMFGARKRPKIIFVYAKRYEYSGSTVMRGDQLSRIIHRYAGQSYRIYYRAMSLKFRNSLLFLTKGAVTDYTVDELALLRGRGNHVVLDPVDNPLIDEKATQAHAIIAASLEAFDSYVSRGYRTYLVNHHVDTRLSGTGNALPVLRCAYFGELINTVRTEKISQKVDFIQVDTGRQNNAWLDRLKDYNLHYAIRAENGDGFKPFLKGFTAAACGANILIQSTQKEAVRWLGKDYPYLLRKPPTEANILAIIRKIGADYNGPIWCQARDTMQKIREKTSDENIAREFISMAQAVLSL